MMPSMSEPSLIVTPVKAGVQGPCRDSSDTLWIPACAGMTRGFTAIR
jgi:hypothetical protein